MSPFTLRVYGIHINSSRQLLLTDEYRLETYMTKFPGGGMEPGEGPIDCLRRECREELGMEITVLDHFYTTDFYQPTRLLPKPKQLISIYYRIDIQPPYKFSLTGKKFDFPPIEGQQTFRWLSLDHLDPEEFTFSIDRVVGQMLKSV